MPTRKSTNNSEETAVLKKRISDLTDRIITLENNLSRTQERIQSDMKMLFEKVNGR
tara:strand:- start:162 stop:329 length:168 start_codon:yes stop_codon:yes gene_type:complete